MGKPEKLYEVLDECLERIMVRGEGIEECLQDYPEHVDELRSLLQTALTVRRVSTIQPRPEFMARARYQFQSAVQAAKARKVRRFLWQPAPVWGTVMAVVLVFILASGITVAAAGNSMPDEALYPVKTAIEQVRLGLTLSPVSKAKLNTELADKRVAEIVYLANKGEAKDIELVAQRLSRNLEKVAELSAVPRQVTSAALTPAPKSVLKQDGSKEAIDVKPNTDREKLKMAVVRYAIRHPALLREALKKAPESVKPALRKAIALSEEGYQKAQRSLED